MRKNHRMARLYQRPPNSQIENRLLGDLRSKINVRGARRMHQFDHHTLHTTAAVTVQVIRNASDPRRPVAGDPSTRTAPHLRRLLLCTGVLFFSQCSALLAHKDRLIELKGTRLVGLPEKFTRAELDLKAGELRIGHRAMTFSPLLKSLFDQPRELVISASWYHDPETLPPYICLHIKPREK